MPFVAWWFPAFCRSTTVDSTTHDLRFPLRILIDRAIEYGGSYYLTYHHWATRQQVETAYPQFVDFLRLKLNSDRDERFQSYASPF